MFEQSFAVAPSRSAKRRRPRRKDVFSEEEYPEATAKMVELGLGIQLPVRYDNSDT